MRDKKTFQRHGLAWLRSHLCLFASSPYARKGGVKSLLWLSGVVLAATLAVITAIWVVTKGMEAREECTIARCKGSLGILQMALRQYHEQHGCMPPAFLADQSGKPMHSWRVLILPHLSMEYVYERYNFDEPWNGPNNRRLAESPEGHQAAEYFRCSADSEKSARQGCASYFAVVGTDTMWPGEDSLAEELLATNQSKLLLTEMRDSGIHWMEPRDISENRALKGLLESSPHHGAVNFARGDRVVGTLERDTRRRQNTIRYGRPESWLISELLRIKGDSGDEKGAVRGQGEKSCHMGIGELYISAYR